MPAGCLLVFAYVVESEGGVAGADAGDLALVERAAASRSPVAKMENLMEDDPLLMTSRFKCASRFFQASFSTFVSRGRFFLALLHEVDDGLIKTVAHGEAIGGAGDVADDDLDA